MAAERFDVFAGNYREILDENIRISGEGSRYFAEYKARYVARRLGTAFSGKILDFGCGVGLLSSSLKRLLPNAMVNGYDVSAASIKRVEPNLLAQGLFTSDPERIGQGYDLIVLSNVMHHIGLENRQDMILGLRDRLAPSGRLAVFEHNPSNPLTRWVVAHCPFDEDAILLLPGETENYMRRSQLQVVHRDYVVFFPHFLAWLRPLEPYLGWCGLGAQFVMIGQREN